jgi:uncharacterized protein DUF11/Big-like domain-containing protein
MKIFLLKPILVYLLLSGLTMVAQNRNEKSSDGPISVNLGDVFKRGKIKIEDADESNLPPLPRGYSAMPRMAYRITTDAEAVGPYTVVFGVQSISDEQAFDSLRILHIEPDEFDPDSSVWVDRTASGANASAPDFSHKMITAYSDELETGIYVIAKLTERIGPSTAVADVEVVAQPAPGAVQMPANITLSVTVKNNGPQTATDVGLKQQISRGPVVSMKPSQGTCKWKPGWVYCKVGQLPAGVSATILLVIDPSGDFVGQYQSYVEVAAKEIDGNPENNRTVATADTWGDPNLPPEVTLESPQMEQLFEPGETVIFKATASDPDGSIVKIEFLDNDESIGVGATTDARHFSLRSAQLANGFHVLNAIATDNGGRQTRSNAKQIFVNGPVKVRILKPKSESELTAGSDLILTVVATHLSGAINKVEVFYNGGFSLGQATPVADNRYTIKLRSLEKTNYAIEAVATDNSGRISKSVTLNLKVMK